MDIDYGILLPQNEYQNSEVYGFRGKLPKRSDSTYHKYGIIRLTLIFMTWLFSEKQGL